MNIQFVVADLDGNFEIPKKETEILWIVYDREFHWNMDKIKRDLHGNVRYVIWDTSRGIFHGDGTKKKSDTVHREAPWAAAHRAFDMLVRQDNDLSCDIRNFINYDKTLSPIIQHPGTPKKYNEYTYLDWPVCPSSLYPETSEIIIENSRTPHEACQALKDLANVIDNYPDIEKEIKLVRDPIDFVKIKYLYHGIPRDGCTQVGSEWYTTDVQLETDDRLITTGLVRHDYFVVVPSDEYTREALIMQNTWVNPYTGKFHCLGKKSQFGIY